MLSLKEIARYLIADIRRQFGNKTYSDAPVLKMRKLKDGEFGCTHGGSVLETEDGELVSLYPYIPLQMFNATGEYKPQTEFKTRYGIIKRKS